MHIHIYVFYHLVRGNERLDNSMTLETLGLNLREQKGIIIATGGPSCANAWRQGWGPLRSLRSGRLGRVHSGRQKGGLAWHTSIQI